MLQRLERAGVRPVSELSPESARRLGMRLYDLERAEGEASLLRQLMRLKSASSTQLAELMGTTGAEMEQRLDRLYLSGALFRQERQPGLVTWSTRISQKRRTLQDRGLMNRLADPSHAIPVPQGASDRLTTQTLYLGSGLQARLYRPPSTGTARLPVVLFSHGGGWVIGSVETHDGFCRDLCARSGCAFLSVEYRLAPEHPWPAAPDDLARALQWLLAHGEDLGLDPARLGVMGDSAGANLALVTAMTACHGGPCQPRVLVLVCPALDPLMGLPSHVEHAAAPFLSAADMGWYYKHYAPDPQHWRGSPLQGDLSRLPPTLVITAGQDLLRDDGVVLADRLEAAGSGVILQHYENHFHDFPLFSSAIAAGREACDLIAGELRQRLLPP
jgi:acetyl esterase